MAALWSGPMERDGDVPDQWRRVLDPAVRSAVLIAESLQDPTGPVRPRRDRPRMRDRILRLVRRVRRRLQP